MVKGIRSEKLTGTAGELLTAFKLTMLGVHCDLVKQDGTDIIAIKGHGLPMALRVEVKTSTHTNEKYKKNKGSVGFTITASLKSMGLVPRSNGRYVLGKKYQLLQ